MNRKLMAVLFKGLFEQASGGEGGGGGAAGGEVKIAPADARTFLAGYGHSADGLKTMPDDKVLELHGSVSGAIKKASESAVEGFKTSEAKRIETEKAAKIAAVKDVDYGLKLGETSLLDSSYVDQIAAHGKAQGWSKEEAAQNLASIEQQVHDRREANVKTWTETVKTDKELGGDNYKATTENVQRFVAKFAPEGSDLAVLLHKSGYGSHPAIVRVLSQIGAAMKEDRSLNKIGEGGSGGGEKKTAADVLYGPEKK